MFSLLQQQDGLGPRDIQKRLFLRNIQSGGHAAFVRESTSCRPLCSASTVRFRIPSSVSSCRTVKIIARELRRDHQPHVLEIGPAFA